MPQIKWSDFDLKVMVSLGNFAAIVFFGAQIWTTTTGDIANNKRELVERKAEIVELRKEISALRTQDTSIAVIKVDLAAVKDTITELKTSIQRIEARVIDRLPVPR